MLQRLNTLHEPSKIYQTGGNPVLVTCEDFNYWICKHGRLSNGHLFNELLGSCFAEIWGLRTPEICFINVKDEHIPENHLNQLQPAFFKKPCFGSLYLENSKEIDSSVIHLLKNSNFKKNIKNKYDFLKIALFDIWLSNEDRNHNNSNLLLDFSISNEYYFYVFDHDSIFNSNSLQYGLYQITEDESIINTELSRILFKQNAKFTQNVDKIVENFYLCISACESNLNEILGLVPKEWEIDIEGVKYLMKEYLFTDTWTDECVKNFRSLIQAYI